MKSVVDMKANESGVITALKMDDPAILRKLMALGVVEGSDLKLLQRFPSYIIQVGYTQIAIDSDVASSIFVTVTTQPLTCAGEGND